MGGTLVGADGRIHQPSVTGYLSQRETDCVRVLVGQIVFPTFSGESFRVTYIFRTD